MRARSDALLKRVDRSATERDLRQMELWHEVDLAAKQPLFKRLAGEEHRREPEETEETHDVGHGRYEHS